MNTPLRRQILCTLLLVGVAATTGACELFRERPPGEVLYRKYCADCHGLDARGNTPRYMGNANADLRDGNWKHSGGDAQGIEDTVKAGIFGKMPGFSYLTDKDITLIADWVLHLRGEVRR
jgi:mono/diheme cytochrome c family protein